MNNLWPWRNLLASVCIARLPTGLSFSLPFEESEDSDHKTAKPQDQRVQDISHVLSTTG